MRVPFYKHYSFDLWLTLIKSDPSFKQERTKFFYNNLNFGGKTLEEIALIFRRVDLMCNAVNEKTGKNIDAEEMYLMVIDILNDHSYPLTKIDLGQLLEEMDLLFFKHMPLLYSPETPDVLCHLKETGNATISILSNTGFIKGRTLRKVLERLGIDVFFDFQLYSDETGMSKPNPKLFQLMLDNIYRHSKASKIDLKEIIHVGDNPRADIEGANSIGIHSLLINSNSTPILSLVN